MVHGYDTDDQGVGLGLTSWPISKLVILSKYSEKYVKLNYNFLRINRNGKLSLQNR